MIVLSYKYMSCMKDAMWVSSALHLSDGQVPAQEPPKQCPGMEHHQSWGDKRVDGLAMHTKEGLPIRATKLRKGMGEVLGKLFFN